MRPQVFFFLVKMRPQVVQCRMKEMLAFPPSINIDVLMRKNSICQKNNPQKTAEYKKDAQKIQISCTKT